MTENHPITPTPELVHQWHREACKDPYNTGTFFMSKTLNYMCARAAQWGADQELEACCALLDKFNDGFWCDELRAGRRPKPPCLKERSLKHLEVMERDRHYLPEILQDLRRALEQLDD